MVTALIGTLSTVDTAQKAAGIHLSGTESVSITDTAANLANKTFATTTSTSDQLHVGLTSGSTNLSGLTGFEDIYLTGSARATQVITLGNSDTTVHAASASTVVMGTGHQSFISSAGTDVVTLSAGSTFVFADRALSNGNDTLKNFVTGSANSTLNFTAFLGSYTSGTSIVDSTSEFGGGVGTVTLVNGLDTAALNVDGFGLSVQNTISLADFTTTGYLSAVNGKEVLITIDNTAHTANVYYVNSALGGSATTVDSAADIVKVGTITLTGVVTEVADLHTTASLSV